MTYTWYKIFNADEFLALNLISKTYTLILEDLGQKSFLVTNAITTGVTHEGVFLPLMLNDQNPFEFEDNAIFFDSNNDVYWGFRV